MSTASVAYASRSGATRSTRTEITPSWFCRTPSSSKNFSARMTTRCLLHDVGREDGVADAGFVLQAQEDKALRGARPLPRNHASGSAHPAATRDLRQFVGREHARAASDQPGDTPWDAGPP